MILSEILVRSNAVKYATPVLSRPMHALLGLSGPCAGALFLGIVCGFPVGAKTAVGLYTNGLISRKDAERVMCFCNCPSFAFTVYAIGEGLWQNRDTGVFIYLLILRTTLFYALISSLLVKKKNLRNNGEISETSKTESPSLTLPQIFTSSVTNAANAMIGVCAYVLFFFCAVGALSSMMGGISATPVGAALCSFFELTSGATACADISDPRIGLILTAAAGCWSGVSVHLQIYSIVKSEANDISFKPYLFSKAVCALLAAIFAAVFLFFVPSFIPTVIAPDDLFIPTVSYPEAFVITSNAITVLFFLFYLYKKLDRKHRI
jgi:hypothetical protein